MERSNIFLCLIMFMCICLVGCSKEDKVVGGFGTGETDVSESITESSVSNDDKFAIKDDVVLSTEDIVESSDTESLSSLQQDKINKIKKDLMSQNTAVTEEDVIELLNTDDFIELSDLKKEEIISDIIEKVNNNSSISETLDSNLVYKHATSYETDEIIIDEEAPSRSYSEEELEVMHSEAEKLYQKQEESNLAEIHTIN